MKLININSNFKIAKKNLKFLMLVLLYQIRKRKSIKINTQQFSKNSQTYKKIIKLKKPNRKKT